MFGCRYWHRGSAVWRRIVTGNGKGKKGGGQGQRIFRFERCAWALAGGVFTFQNHGISEERLQRGHSVRFERNDSEELKTGWELLYEEKEWNLRVFRRRVPGVKLEVYEYRVAGTFRDITPRHYIDAQNDVQYRSEWDHNVLKLEIIQDNGEQQLVRWVSKYPYPMYPREYVFVRRSYLSKDNKVVVIESEVIPEEVVPTSSRNNVRVATYTSQCAVRAHSDLDSHGLDYVLTYFDNPEANIPTYVYNWIVNQGGPYFVKQVHAAAKQLETSGRSVNSFFNIPGKQLSPSSITPSECQCTHSCPVHCPSDEATQTDAILEPAEDPTEAPLPSATTSTPSETPSPSPLTQLVAKIVPGGVNSEKADDTKSEIPTSIPPAKSSSPLSDAKPKPTDATSSVEQTVKKKLEPQEDVAKVLPGENKREMREIVKGKNSGRSEDQERAEIFSVIE